MGKAEQEQLRKEDARRAVLRYLAIREGLSFSLGAIVAGLRHEGAFDEDEVKAALHFREGLGHVRKDPDAVGSTPYWQATAPGVLAHERGQ